MKRKVFVFLGIFLLLLSCRPSDHQGKQVIHVAVLKGPSAISMISLIDEGFTWQHKQAVFTIYSEPAQVEASIARGEADIALVPGNMGAVLYNRGFPYKLAAVPVWGTLYLAGCDPAIHSWEQLRGKRVYQMARGATPDIVFRYLLQWHHLQPDKDVAIDYSFPSHIGLSNALAAGQASMGVIAEPYVSLASSKNRSIRVILDLGHEWSLYTSDSIPMVQTAVMVNDSAWQADSLFISAFFTAYKNAADWLENHMDKAADLCVKHTIVPDRQVALSALKRCNIRFEDAYTNRQKIMKYYRLLAEGNPDVVGGKCPDTYFILVHIKP